MKKRLTLESEKKALIKRLNEMYAEECAMEEGEIEEGIGSFVKKVGAKIGQTIGTQ